jgi:glutamyl-tRNA reductase
MDLIVTGLSHQTASLEEREAATLRGEKLPDALARLARLAGEGAILSTCNRTEIYAYSDGDPAAVAATLRAALLGPAGSGDQWYTRSGADAAAHLFRVAAGLDSLVPGEVQPLGQTTAPWPPAQPAGVAGPVCSALFQRALAAGKRVRSTTAISALPASISYAAVSLVRRILGRLEGRRVLVVGAGVMGEAVARCLMENGAGALLVANRHAARALALAAAHGGSAVAWDDLPVALAAADVVISATDAPGFVLPMDLVRKASHARPETPLHLIDLAVPRDIDPECAGLPGVFLHNIDDLRDVVDAGLAARRAALPAATAIVEEEAAAFRAWLESRRAAPTIEALRRRADAIRQNETEWALSHLNDLSARDRQIVEALAARLVGKLLHEPTVRLRELAAAPEGDTYTEAIHTLFDL